MTIKGGMSEVSGLKMTVTDDANLTIIKLGEKLDVYTAPELRQAFNACLAAETKEIIVSVAELEYVDSTGLGVLIYGNRKQKESNRGYSLVCPVEAYRIHRVLEITNLIGQVFTVFESIEEAKAAIKSKNEQAPTVK